MRSSPAPSTLDLAIQQLATANHGVVTTRQLVALGLSATSVAARVRAGRLVRLHQGVLAVGHCALSREGWWLAAVRSVGPDAALSHGAAGALWGIWTRGCAPLEVTGGRRHRSIPGVVTHRSRTINAGDISLRAGVPVTSVARTLLDLGDTLTPHQVARAIHEARYLGLVEIAELQNMVTRGVGRRAGRVLAKAIDLYLEGSIGTRSNLEDRFLEVMRRAGYQPPRVNVRLVERRGTFQILRNDAQSRSNWIEVDTFWPARRLNVEVDGRTSHSRPADRSRDRHRDERLAAIGIRVVRLTFREIERAERAGRLPARLLRALAK